MHLPVLLLVLAAELTRTACAASASSSLAVGSERPEFRARRQLSLAEVGFLDVTAAPYRADPTGRRDSTQALQAAIDAAYRQELVCFFPAGVYLVSDTLLASQDPNTHERANCLVGSTAGPARPKLRLAAGTPGFGDPERPKAMVRIWTRPNAAAVKRRPDLQENSSDPDQENAAQGFLQCFRGIDLEIGRDNPGAVGLRMTGSQHCEVADLTVRMESGFAGIYNLPGVNGTVANLEIIGGRYGIYGPKAQYPTITGVTLRDQTELALHDLSPNPVLVGFRIQKKRAPAISVVRKQWKNGYGSGEMALLDGVIEIEEPTDAPVIDNTSGAGFVMRNVSVRHGRQLVQSGANAPIAGKGEWTLVREYAYAREDRAPSGDRVGWHYVEGVLRGGEIVDAVAGKAPVKDYRAHHLYRFEDLPSADVLLARFNRGDPQVAVLTGFPEVPVKAAGLASDKGNTSGSDIGANLQRIVDAFPFVLVPKGLFLTGRTVTLRRDTRLLGVAVHLAEVRTHENWKPTSPTDVITTVDEAAAKTVLGQLKIGFETKPREHNWFCGLHWRAGRSSLVRQIFLRPLYHNYQAEAGQPRAAWRISGHGGGRWYGTGLGPLWTAQHPDARVLLVDGTTEPLVFYNLNVERGLGDHQAEFRGARNVAILQSKHEFQHAFYFNRCTNVVLLVDSGSAQSLFEDCADVFVGIIANKKFRYDAGDGVKEADKTRNLALREIIGGRVTVALPTEKIISLYRRGRVDFGFLSE